MFIWLLLVIHLFVYHVLAKFLRTLELRSLNAGMDTLEGFDRFFYLTDMLSWNGAVTDAVSASKQLCKLTGVLIGKQGLSLKRRGKLYRCYVRPVLLYSSEIWKLLFTDEVAECLTLDDQSCCV